jgi:hypothetical protein
VGEDVGLGVGVGRGVRVGEGEAVGVDVGVAVGLPVGDDVGEDVGVGVGEAADTTVSGPFKFNFRMLSRLTEPVMGPKPAVLGLVKSGIPIPNPPCTLSKPFGVSASQMDPDILTEAVVGTLCFHTPVYVMVPKNGSQLLGIASTVGRPLSTVNRIVAEPRMVPPRVAFVMEMQVQSLLTQIEAYPVGAQAPTVAVGTVALRLRLILGGVCCAPANAGSASTPKSERNLMIDLNLTSLFYWLYSRLIAWEWTLT